MDGLVLASIAFLSTIFCVIGGFIIHVFISERNSRRARETLEAMGLNEENQQRRTRENRSNNTENNGVESDDVDREDEAFDDPLVKDKKIGKKKLAKLQAKAEAKAQREHEITEREERKRVEEIRAKEEDQKRLLQEEEGRKVNEKIRLEKEERKRRELEEYNKLKESFCVEEQGIENELDDDEDPENKITRFIDLVKSMKVVQIDELASKLLLKSEDIINRLTSLMEEKKISGVFDDRGKFIYISQDELIAVSKFFKQRGRVSLQQLVQYSNQLISLDSQKTE